MIKNLRNNVMLAPMAGVTDRAFREIAVQMGAGLVFSEMVSIKGLYYNDKNTAALLDISQQEKPVAVQVFGHEPDIMAAVAKKAVSTGAAFLDINCGCPVRKITSNGEGSALMRKPEVLAPLIEAAVQHSGVPVTVKIRKGWNNQQNAVEIAKLAQRCGASMITVHGRTAEEFFTGRADWDIIRQVVKAVDIPVVGNGDIYSPQDAKAMLEQTGCAGVMIGQGAMGNPFLIRQVQLYLETGELIPPPTNQEKISCLIGQLEKMVEYKGEYIGIREGRKHAMWYVKGMHGAAKVKREICQAQTLAGMKKVLEQLL